MKQGKGVIHKLCNALRGEGGRRYNMAKDLGHRSVMEGGGGLKFSKKACDFSSLCAFTH